MQDSANEEDRVTNSTLVCICNLCNCGQHKCSSFRLESRASQSIQTGDMELVDKASQSEDRENAPHNRCRADMTESKFQGQECGVNRCDCYDRERYLTRTAAESKVRLSEGSGSPQTGNESGKNELDELLHVLVTRPEIASRPRDNIIFEGDMDLKTTFETSYEALAKMRLDYFKKHQSQLEEKQRFAGGSLTEAKMSSTGTEINKTTTRKKLQKYKSDPLEEEQGEVLEEKINKSNGEHDKNTDRQNTPVATMNRLDKSAAIKKTTCNTDNKQQYLTMTNDHREDQSMMKQKSEAEANVTVEETAEKSSPNHHNQSGVSQGSQLDPDLSPLIVYNANMNRLDTVGLRKRSKYRPSTTLRAGKRGLFGDCEEPPEELIAQRTQPSLPSKKEVEINPINKSEQVLRVRNLRGSKQANYLVYSDFNLPVDSKRKIQDNINMRDHIKEQSIVDGSSHEAAHSILHEDANDVLLRRSIQDLKLLQEEERDAFNEIKRVISPIQEVDTTSKSHSNHIHDLESVDPENKLNSASRSSNRTYIDEGRQSKLQRTCQNQNFDIFQGQYPEEPEPKSNLTGIRRESPQSKYLQHNNSLFRESPDFILATRGYAIGKTVVNDTPSNTEHQDKHHDYTSNDDYMLINQDDRICKVLNLDENFHYVGSLAGHNYFVHK